LIVLAAPKTRAGDSAGFFMPVLASSRRFDASINPLPQIKRDRLAL
jgi:hypothetical protein